MAHLQIALLGPLHVTLDEQPVINFGYDKVRALLAYLVVESHRLHDRGALATLLWPGEPEVVARKNLRTALATLRRAIGNTTAIPPLLLITRDTIQFDRSGDYALDVTTFTTLLAEVERHAHPAGELCDRCAARLAQAAELYRGEFLQQVSVPSSVAWEEWVLLMRGQLHGQVLDALAQLIGYHENRQQDDRARRYAWRALALESWDETAHRCLMRVLARNGQRAAALAQYERCRNVLTDELGIAPAAETTALYERIRAEPLELAVGVHVARPRPRPVSGFAKANLPTPPNALIGRAQDVAVLSARLRQDSVRLLTLTGPPGIGKTRLGLQVAMELADDFADGVWFIPLAPIDDPELVAAAIAQPLDLRETSDQPFGQLLKIYLREKALLLVLDNFEHVVSAAELIAELLAACPQLKILTTSRAALRVQAERQFPVAPLALPDLAQLPSVTALTTNPAVALFIERAQAVRPDFGLLEEHALAVAAICVRLDGLPLAIELAAARSNLFPPQMLLTRLEQRLALLTDGSRDLPPRQRTLRGAIAWSYALLERSEQALFRRLGVFVGGCTLDALAEMCATNGDLGVDAVAVLAALVDQHLVGQEEASGEPRYTMLETIREYALEQLAISGEVEVMRRWHVTFYVRMAEAAAQRLRSGDQAGGITLLRQEHANLLATIGWAIEHNEAELALQLTGSLGWFWDLHGQLTEGQAWLTRALALDGAVSPAVRARALVSAGLLAADYNDPATAQAHFLEALAMYQDIGNITEAAYTLSNLGRVKRFVGDYDGAQAYLTDALALAQRAGDIRSVAYAHYNLARVSYQRGDYATAHGLFMDSLAGFQSCRDSWGIALAHCNLGRIAYRQSDYVAAEMRFSESLIRFTAINDVWGMALAHCKLGWIALGRSDHQSAQAHFTESLPSIQKVGYREGLADVLTGLAMLARAQGEWEQMVHRLSAAGALLDAIRGALNTFEPDDYDQAITNARASLSAAAFTAAWEQGRHMPLDLLLILDRDLSTLEHRADGSA